MSKQKSNQILVVSSLEGGLRWVTVRCCLILLLGPLLFSSCQKRYDEKATTIEVSLRNPVTNVGYAGLRVNVVGIQYEKNKPEVREILQSVVTDANGHASVSFNRATYHDLSRKDYDYEITFDKTLIDAPPGDYYSTIPVFAKADFNELNTFELKFMPHGGLVIYFKNVHCYDANDV